MFPVFQKIKDRIAQFKKDLPTDGKLLTPEQIAAAKKYAEQQLLKAITDRQEAIENGLEALGIPEVVAQKIIAEVLAKLAADITPPVV